MKFQHSLIWLQLSPEILRVQTLLEAGADLERGNAAGVTALAASSFFGHEPVVRMLLSRGANRSAKNP